MKSEPSIIFFLFITFFYVTASASKSDDSTMPPRRIQAKTVDVSKCVSDRVSMIHKVTAPKQVSLNIQTVGWHCRLAKKTWFPCNSSFEKINNYCISKAHC